MLAPDSTDPKLDHQRISSLIINESHQFFINHTWSHAHA